MRAAPAVRVRCEVGGAWRLLQAGLYGVAMASLAAWGAQRADVSAPSVMLWAAAAALVASTIAMRFLCCGTASLNWSGAAWLIDLGGPAGDVELQRVDIMLDLGAALLLRLSSSKIRRAVWLPVHQRDAGASYPLLCAALYASRPV